MITARVSNVAAFARWKEDEDSDVGWLIADIRSSCQTPAMAKGTAFHKLLEHSRPGEDFDTVTVDGYTFSFVGDFSLYRPPVREWRKGKDYGGITVSGQVDAIAGNTIWDDKSTEHFDAEKYLTSWQHKFYMDIFEADRFIWNIWEMKLVDSEVMDDEPIPLATYEVRGLHHLTQYRYPGMGEDCRELALEYKEFAEKYLEVL